MVDHVGGVMKRDTHHDSCIVFDIQLNLVFVFVLYCIVFVFCILYVVVVDRVGGVMKRDTHHEGITVVLYLRFNSIWYL